MGGMSRLTLKSQDVAQTDQEKFEALRKLGVSETRARFMIAIGNGTLDSDIQDIPRDMLPKPIQQVVTKD
jgi:hypothetical protein